MSNETHIIFLTSHTFSHTSLRKLEVRICGNFQKNNLKIASHLTKTETSLVIWLNIVTIVAGSVRLLSAHMREDFSPLVDCIVNDGLVSAIPNMQKTLLQSQHLFR